MSLPFSNNINSLNTAINVWNHTTPDERPQILAWLSPLEPRIRHKDIQERPVENVGEWLLQSEEFRGWCAGSGRGASGDAVLFCYGNPGVGKTYISSLVIDGLCDQARGQNVLVTCFYFDFGARKEQSPTSVLGALLKQVVGGLERVPEEVVQAYEGLKEVVGGRVPQLSDIVTMLQTISSAKPMFICIDALDECAAEHRAKLLISLSQILQKSPGTRIFVTGRPHIQDEIGKRLSGRVMAIAITPRKDDIIRYLHSRLDEDTIPDAMDSSLEADILKKIPEDISEIFLLVSLNIGAILRETTIHRRRQKLNAMTDGLGLRDAYDATLTRIKGQGGERERLRRAALMWISHAERPLKPDELCHALAVEIGSPTFNSDNVPSIGTLLACCQGLVVVDKEASTVRLIHFSLQEYLRAHPELFGRAHSTIAETCLSYLNSHQVKALSTGPFPGFFGDYYDTPPHYLRDQPFLEYSSVYWGIHTKKDLSDYAKFLALELLGDYYNHISSNILLTAQEQYNGCINYYEPLFLPGLHCASIFGIDDIVARLLEVEGGEINQQDCVGNTALVWAASNGHEGVVEILLGRDDVDPNEPDYGCGTPLANAIENGRERVVEMLLGRHDVDPNSPTNEGHTPLVWAIENGCEGVLKILLGRNDVDPNQSGEDGQTPLSYAAEHGHEGMVKMLLRRDDIDPNKLDSWGQTPLSHSAGNGHERIVELLLERADVDPDLPAGEGKTPLALAAICGQEGTLKLLLERDDVDPNKPDNEGCTSLGWAIRGGHEGVVKMLLGRDEVDLKKLCMDGYAPLEYATRKGRVGLVKLLLEQQRRPR